MHVKHLVRCLASTFYACDKYILVVDFTMQNILKCIFEAKYTKSNYAFVKLFYLEVNKTYHLIKCII